MSIDTSYRRVALTAPAMMLYFPAAAICTFLGRVDLMAASVIGLPLFQGLACMKMDQKAEAASLLGTMAGMGVVGWRGSKLDFPPEALFCSRTMASGMVVSSIAAVTALKAFRRAT